ncbi:hypothetical protein N657DRAFT_708625 [Parathielavia appendiculata]|uniref:Uncharacterized protein n=1 Tax=Parathielavia appendiculata TaxID=2587402 RepID=A0AAN6U3G6_9PEZI|nr:hypothetical protein N657DRAFT_708625 [Parathielavia appendiculata]
MGQSAKKLSTRIGPWSWLNSEDDRWVEQAWFIDDMLSKNWVELMTIAEALNMATLRLRLQPEITTVVHIFTNSEQSLEYLTRKSGCKRLLDDIVMEPNRYFIKKLSRELHERGGWLVLSRIPGHKHDVVGHAKADKCCTQRFSSRTESLGRH